MDLAEFLKARLDEDEERAKAVAAEDGEYRWVDVHSDIEQLLDCGGREGDYAALARQILREVAAKRTLITELVPWLDGAEDDHWYNRGVGTQPPYEGSVLLLKILAAVYSDHPDYQSEWKP